jgi:hypothetical protein
MVLRGLTKREVASDYAVLRWGALRNELSWTHSNPRRAEDLLDAYDATAVSLGLFDRERLVGAIRLVTAPTPETLPSGSFMPPAVRAGKGCAEFSKGIVVPDYRHCGVFRVLVAASLHVARLAQFSCIFVSILDTVKGRALFLPLGFKAIGSPFFYKDRTIAPTHAAILLMAQEPVGTFDEERSACRLQSLLDRVAATVEKRRTIGG